MKEQILKYLELSPNRGYYDLCKIFGLSMKKLFKILNIKNYIIEDSYIEFYDNNDNRIYWEGTKGKWYKWEYNDKGKLVKTEDSYGYILNY